VWEERFGEGRYTALGEQAWSAALKHTGLAAGDIDQVVIAGSHPRAAAAVLKKTGVAGGADFLDVVGWTGAAHPALLLTAALEGAETGRVVALVSLADGADVLLFRTAGPFAPARPVRAQVEAKGSISYGKFLAWRGVLPVEPPRRPEPARVSASAAGRHADWKFGLVASRSGDRGEIRMPPEVGAHEAVVMADTPGTVVTFTVDRLAYSPSPPIVFAVVDFDGGGRLPAELTDVDASAVSIGDRVEPTFRRLSTADGIHNYFWKMRPIRGAAAGSIPASADGSPREGAADG
jgi:uncharacterized OB-fold protein